MNKEATQKIIDQHFDSWYVKGLQDFVRVPNLTPMVDENYLTNGLVEQAIDLVDKYLNELGVKGVTRTIVQPAGKTPLVIYVIEATAEGPTNNVLVYGHLDKQPWCEGWLEGLHPTDPVIRGDYMFGRGVSDDGYAPFSCFLAVKAA
jgi:acetylornithine deacetylase/succinyl-diaminopimelate desuccinylase-like protein